MEKRRPSGTGGPITIALGTFLVVHEVVEGRWPSVIAWFVAAVLAGVGFAIYARRRARG